MEASGMIKILVTGSRDWTNKDMILQAFQDEGLWFDPRYYVVIHGAAKGADTLAGQIAANLGVEVLEYPADWDQYGKAAGVIRNQQMLDEHPDIDLCLAFSNDIGKSKGTWDMIKRVNKAGIEVRLYSEGQ